MLVSLRSSLLVCGRLCGLTRLKSTSSRGRTKPSSSPPPAVLALLAGDKTIRPSKRLPNAAPTSHRSPRPDSRPRLNLQSEETNDAAREVANTIHGPFQRLPWSPPPRKRVGGPLSAIRLASTSCRRPLLRTLAAIHSDRPSGIKILFPATPRLPRLDLSSVAGTLDESATWSTADLVAAVGRVAVEPAPLDGSPLYPLQVQLASVGRLQAPDQAAAFRTACRQLIALTRTAEDAVEVADWLIRVTAREANASQLLYESIVGLTGHVDTIHPRPPPESYLSLFANHAQRLSRTFARNPHPLVLLLEVYTRLFAQDQRRLNPIAQSPPPAVMDEINRLRQQHLNAVRAIHNAMRDSSGRIFTQRSTNSLMEAYGHGRSFERVQQIWEAARTEGGTGIDRQGVAIYFDACGFNGALSQALAGWRELQETGFPLNENNYASHHECVTRCGAWDDLALSFNDQQTRHLADPAGVPPLFPPLLAATVKLANRLVKEPRHRSLRPVDLTMFMKLCAQLKSLAGKEVWAKTERLLKSNERYTKASKTVPLPSHSQT